MSEFQNATLKVAEPTQLTIAGPDGKPLLTIHADGRWEFRDDAAPTEAAAVFVREVQRMAGDVYTVEQIRAAFEKHASPGCRHDCRCAGAPGTRTRGDRHGRPRAVRRLRPVRHMPARVVPHRRRPVPGRGVLVDAPDRRSWRRRPGRTATGAPSAPVATSSSTTTPTRRAPRSCRSRTSSLMDGEPSDVARARRGRRRCRSRCLRWVEGQVPLMPFVCLSDTGPGPCVNPVVHTAPGGCVHHSTSGVPDRHDRPGRGDSE